MSTHFIVKAQCAVRRTVARTRRPCRRYVVPPSANRRTACARCPTDPSWRTPSTMRYRERIRSCRRFSTRLYKGAAVQSCRVRNHADRNARCSEGTTRPWAPAPADGHLLGHTSTDDGLQPYRFVLRVSADTTADDYLWLTARTRRTICSKSPRTFANPRTFIPLASLHQTTPWK